MAMKMNDLIIVSVDDHVVEPPTMFHDHMPRHLLAKAPKVVTIREGDGWEFEGARIPNFGLNAVVGRPPEEYGFEPASYSDIRKGTYDIKLRVDDMNANGILGSICFPTFPTFAGSFFLGAKDKELAKVVISAYNDWHMYGWCGQAPGRFIPLAMLPLWDIDACVAEARRVAKMGARTITFLDNPTAKGLPSVHSGHWDPLWAVMQEEQMVISIHIGSGATAPYPSSDAPIDAWIVNMPMYIANAATEWLFSPVFKKFPRLKIALSEGGIGWIPYWLERADFTFKHHHAWTNANFDGMLPSELFARNFITCFIDDQFGLKNTDSLNVDMITYECDYPHSDTLWPGAPEALWSSIKHLPDETIHKITHGNAMREFRYDPIPLLGRENCTVDALRGQASHVDTRAVAGLGGVNPSNREGRQVTAGEVAKLFAS
jgi:predicted TIM-barrel fold metal-dependent hydrolase